MNPDYQSRLKERYAQAKLQNAKERKILKKAAADYNESHPFPFKVGETIVRAFAKSHGQIFIVLEEPVPHAVYISSSWERNGSKGTKGIQVGWMVKVMALAKICKRKAGPKTLERTKPEKKKKFFITSNAISSYYRLADVPLYEKLDESDDEILENTEESK